MARILDELGRIYDDLDREAAGDGASCRACGVCCDFRRSGLILFAEPIEVAAFVRAQGAVPSHARRMRGAHQVALRRSPSPAPAVPALCPAWDGTRCGERAWRPIGCRTYFCDRAAGERGREAHERALRRVRRACEAAGYPLGYGPFLAALVSPELGDWLDRLGGRK